MNRVRKIKFTAWAQDDIHQLDMFIKDICHAPDTAKRYHSDLRKRMQILKTDAEIFAPIPELTWEFGFEVKRLNFKNTAVIYSYDDNYVYIQRILPQSMVIY